VELVEVELCDPHRAEVEVEIAATGICHSDLSMLDGALGLPLPAVLGHEAAGVVRRVGADVRHVSPGDRVVLSCMAPCGSCFYCVRGQFSLCEVAGPAMGGGTLLDGTTRISHQGAPVRQAAGLGTFAERCVVPGHAVLGLPDAVPFDQGALLGCAVLTGFGAAVNAAEVVPGESVVVLGCGGVGLSAVQGAVLAGAGEVIAVDPRADRRDLALGLGAARVLDPAEDLIRAVRGLTSGRGADVAIEAAGVQPTVDAALSVARPGGRVVLVGAGTPSVKFATSAFLGLVHTEKQVRGSLYGSAHPRHTIERLLAAYASGALVLGDVVGRRFTFDDLPEAVEHSRSGRGGRTVVTF